MARNRYSSWSPDGKKIAFATDRDGIYEVYVMDADGSNPTNLTITQPTTPTRPGRRTARESRLPRRGTPQHEPVRRKVALKVIKPGMDTRQVIARFEAERQALALMDHPNIAKILDAGATASGRPFFVMELVKGIPITQFCDDNRLTTGERLELFVPVCQAVQHAHHKGIIHRDLKPSNVLVISHDGTPVIKVIDFGVAKAVGQQLTDKTIYTQFMQLVGTPLYMSPEQAGQSGLDVDTRFTGQPSLVAALCVPTGPGLDDGRIDANHFTAN